MATSADYIELNSIIRTTLLIQLSVVNFDIINAAFNNEWDKFDSISNQLSSLSSDDMLALLININTIYVCRTTKYSIETSSKTIPQTMSDSLVKLYKILATKGMPVLDSNSIYWAEAVVFAVRMNNNKLMDLLGEVHSVE